MENQINELKNSIAAFGARNYVYAEKQQQWAEVASKVDLETLETLIELMKLMDGSLPFKKVNSEFNKIKDESVKETVLKLLIEFGKFGPEFAYEKIKKDNHGNINRNDEFIKGLLYKMDENANIRGNEKQ